MNRPISVNELNNQIGGLLEATFVNIYVEGEISNLTYHSSGHIYFSLKDDKSVISCVMFKGNTKNLKFRLEVGRKIIITGALSVYVPRGNYQILCTKIEPSGVGELALAYEQLKAKLQIKGYFDISLKKQLPLYPKYIYVVTSNTGAAIEDMKKILNNRYPIAKMILIPTLVQGNGSKEDIVRSIKKADFLASQQDNSLIIVGRGGGSIEDLWAFNEECVADVIYQANRPIISAVGHENDFVISDFVADIRASTPSNAIEIATPSLSNLYLLLDNVCDELDSKFQTIFYNKNSELKNLRSLFEQHSFVNKFKFNYSNIIYLKNNLNSMMQQLVNQYNHKIELLKINFEQNHPNKKSKKGFVQVTKEGQVIDIDLLDVDKIVNLETLKNKFECKIIGKQKIY